MVGDSMEPRYEQGWLLHVNPFKPPTRGRDVVVYKQGQVVLIKQFVGWDGDALVLRQLNPPEHAADPARRGRANATSSSASIRKDELPAHPRLHLAAARRT